MTNSPNILATDLDGTLIPLDETPANRADLERLGRDLQQSGASLIYVTGRELGAVQRLREQYALPTPQWIICDVGTSIYRWDPEQQAGHLLQDYAEKLDELAGGVSASELDDRVSDFSELRLQEPHKQGPFKRSFYCPGEDASRLGERIERRLEEQEVAYGVIASVDPFNGDGLIDLLPRGVSKAFALQWWLAWEDLEPTRVVFAGDSGNDLAAMRFGYRTIVVSNASEELKRRVRESHQQNGWTDRLFIAAQPATSGVLEGWRHFRAGNNGLR